MTLVVTGSAGFIGSNFINGWFASSDEEVLSLDALTYAGNLNNLKHQDKNKNHHFDLGIEIIQYQYNLLHLYNF